MTGRRRFLRTVAAAGVAGLIAGCTGDETGTPGDGEGGDAAGDSGGNDGGTEDGGETTGRSPTRSESPTADGATGDDATATPTERGPRALGDVHAHGTIAVSVLGERVDLSQRKYQLQDRYFHLEGGNGRVWHLHGRGVTLRYAMDTLGIGVTEDSVAFDGTTYREEDPEYTVSVTVGGEDVVPSEYVLEGQAETPPPRETSSGSHIRIAVSRE